MCVCVCAHTCMLSLSLCVFMCVYGDNGIPYAKDKVAGTMYHQNNSYQMQWKKVQKDVYDTYLITYV